MAKAFLYGNGGDSIDTDQITATSSDIIQGKKAFIDDSGEPKVGTLPLIMPTVADQLQSVADPSYGAYSTDNPTKKYLYQSMSVGGGTKAYAGVNWVRTEESKVASVVGLTADKLLKGNTILGVAGTANPMTNIIGTKGNYYAYAGQNIKAGNFVKLVTGVSGIGSGTAQWRSILVGRYILDICTISSTQMLVLSCVYASASSYTLYATLVEVDGVEFSVQADVVAGTATASYYQSCRLFNFETGYVSVISGAGVSLYSGLLYISGATITVVSTTSNSHVVNYISVNGLTVTENYVDVASRGVIAPYGHAITGTNYLTIIFYATASTAFRVIALYSVNTSTGALTYISSIYSQPSYPGGSNCISFAYSDNGKVLFETSFNNENNYGGSAMKFDIATSSIIKSATATSMTWYNEKSNYKNCCYYSDTQGVVVSDTTGGAGITARAFTQNGSGFTSGDAIVLESDSSSVSAFTIKLATNVVLLAYATNGTATVRLRTIILNGNTITIGASKDVTGITNARLQNSLKFAHMLYGGKFYIADIATNNADKNNLMILNCPTSSVIETINYLYETQIAISGNRNEINGVALGDATGGIASGANAGHNQATQIITI